MTRLSFLISTLLLIGLPRAGSAQPAPEDEGPYLGILFSPIPAALLYHLPELPRDAGVEISFVLPNSPAAAAGLRKHDLLFTYDKTTIRDGSHLVRLIQAGKADQKVQLGYYRAGKNLTTEARLTWGPALKVAKEEGPQPPGVAKQGGPPVVSVTALPLDGNKLELTFEFYDNGRVRSVPCTGDAEAIDRQIEKLPSHVQPSARIAVERIRKLELQKSDNTPAPRGE